MRISPFIALSSAAFALALAAPALADDTDTQAWAAFTGQYRLSGKLTGSAEFQGRFGDNVGALRQSIVRPSLGWQAAPKVSLWVGYGRITNHRPGKDQAEDRLWQQVLWNVGPALGGNLTSRSRLEQRWVDGGADAGWRLRHSLKYERPLRAGGGAALVLWNETFVALNDADWGARSGLDQTRNFAGVGLSVTPQTRVEIGYLNQYINRPGPNDRMNHVASVSFVARR